MRLLAFLALAVLTTACSTTPDKATTLSEKAYYEAAQKSLSYGNFDTASKHLEDLESHYPVGAYTEQAQLDVIGLIISCVLLMSGESSNTILSEKNRG